MLSVRDVLISSGVHILLGQTEVNDMDFMVAFGTMSSNQKVLWFHVAINEMLRVDILHPFELTETMSDSQHKVKPG